MTVGRADAVTVRWAQPGDEAALRRLAERDSVRVPADPVLVAQEAGEIRAAMGMGQPSVVADPFHPTAHLVELLELRAAQLRRQRSSFPRPRRRAARSRAWRPQPAAG
ncbi:MAG TPA: hypothetical protein VGV36_00480 [Solirubrobacteraceae bacterium]|nr:hypothetical protein [Solirubrobacteraceae bacterium]